MFQWTIQPDDLQQSVPILTICQFPSSASTERPFLSLKVVAGPCCTCSAKFFPMWPKTKARYVMTSSSLPRTCRIWISFLTAVHIPSPFCKTRFLRIGDGSFNQASISFRGPGPSLHLPKPSWLNFGWISLACLCINLSSLHVIGFSPRIDHRGLFLITTYWCGPRPIKAGSEEHPIWRSPVFVSLSLSHVSYPYIYPVF